MPSDVEEKKAQQGRRRRMKSRNNLPSMPTSIVCSPTQASNQPGAVELGLILALLVVGLYLYGFYESATALPDVPPEPDWNGHMGENFNLANSEWTAEAAAAAAAEAADAAEGNAVRREEKHPVGVSEEKKAQVVVADGGNKAGSDSGGGGGAVVVDPVPPKKALPMVQRIHAKGIMNAVPWMKGKDVLQKQRELFPDVPAGMWPVTIRNELDDFETIFHPADGKTEMSVPKFWSPPIHNGRLMNRLTAMQVGTCAQPGIAGDFVRGDKCPVDYRTIFVGIASYRDFQCRLTVESAFSRAKNPDRIRIGVVDQIVDGLDVACNEPVMPCDRDPNQALCKYKDRVDVFEMEAELSVGPVFARHIGYRLYRGEYYATQSDAHVSFTQNWDEDIISQLEATGNEMAVLSTYLTDVQGSIDANGKSTRHTRPIMCNTYYEGGPQGMHLRHGSQPERDPAIHGMPQLQPWWAAGYSFSRGHFIVNVPYDPYQPMIFQGEEMSIGIRGFTVGYDFYAPERSVCFHHYAVGKNAKVRNKVHHFWENDQKYAGTGRSAMARLLGIVHMNPEIDPKLWDHTEEDRYGIGGVRSPEKFYETFGIDVNKKTMGKNLCSFVHNGGAMHKLFTQQLRKDGMGIDYDKIAFRFKDPPQ